MCIRDRTNPDYMEDIDKLPETLDVEIFPGKNSSYCLVEHIKNKVAKTTFEWNNQTRILTINVDDPADIIPESRQIHQKIINYQKSDVIKEAYRRLQTAQTSFELKQKLYLAFSSDKYQYANFINMLNNINDENLRNSLSELAYSREAYHE